MYSKNKKKLMKHLEQGKQVEVKVFIALSLYLNQQSQDILDGKSI